MWKGRKTGLLTFLLVTLTVAVFAWGLQYKLSLYDLPHSIDHNMPQAKLLSNQERAGYTLPAPVSEALAPGAAVPPWSVSLLLIFPALLPRVPTRGAPGPVIASSFTGPIPKIGPAGLTPFFFRPPPRFA